MISAHATDRTPVRAFTLVELLVVLTITGLMAALTVPAMNALRDAGSTNKAVSDLSQTLTLARAYAMAHRTYVRVGFSHQSASSSRPNACTLVLPVYSANGSNDTSMSISSNWPPLFKPVVLENFVPDSTLEGASPDTTNDTDLFDASGGSGFSGQLSAKLPGLGTGACDYYLEFTPEGEARVRANTPARNIKIGLTRSRGSESQAFLLRLSGINGTLTILRKEDLRS